MKPRNSLSRSQRRKLNRFAKEHAEEILHSDPPPMPAADPVAATITERTKIYGDPYLSHKCIGLAWTALIQHHFGILLDYPLPASLVARMMIALKNQRASLVYHEDNFIDAKAYVRFADEFQKREVSVHLPRILE